MNESLESQEARVLARLQPLSLGVLDATLGCVSVLLLALVAWACWAVIEEQIRAPGTVIASSRSQVVQSVDGGTLKAMHVREGDQVRAGDLIAELDPVRFKASSDEIAAKISALTATVERLEAELSGKPLNFSEALQAYPDIRLAQMELHRKRTHAQAQELRALADSAALAERELDVLSRLLLDGDASAAEVLKTQRQVNELRAQQSNRRNAFRQEAQLELAQARGELAQVREVHTQRSEALESTYLRAPMDGTVKNVRVTTLGAVLRAGEELLQIVPSNDPLVVEVKVRPADVAFLRNGLRANVKLDAYDYTIYGALSGHVIYISPDTLEEEQRRNDDVPYYRVHIQTESDTPKGRKPLDVRPGMTTTAEIITGERTIANFVLKPLRRMVDGAFHEP